MNEKEIKTVVAIVKYFCEIFDCKPLPLNVYVELVIALCKGNEFECYSTFDRYSHLSIQVGREPQMAIVKTSGIVNESMTKWLNDRLAQTDVRATTVS